MTGNVEWGQGVGYTNCTHCAPTTNMTKLVGVPFCPDVLRYEDIGAADDMRGRVVRGFFWLMRWWKV